MRKPEVHPNLTSGRLTREDVPCQWIPVGSQLPGLATKNTVAGPDANESPPDPDSLVYPADSGVIALRFPALQVSGRGLKASGAIVNKSEFRPILTRTQMWRVELRVSE